MHWTKIDKKWNDRLTKDGEGDVTWKIEQWQVPGEAPLEVRACVRKDVPVSKFANTKEAPRTSIVLHLTCGYGNFSGLMGGSDHSASAHFILGRCGTPYLLVPTEFTSWHATWWNNNSVGIEIDNIGNLQKRGNNLVSAYGEGKDVYCSTDDKDVFLEKTTNGSKYWATMTEKQYVGLGRLIKALSFKHKIPRLVLPEPQRYKAFDEKDQTVRRDYRGIATHLQIDPARRADIGPYIDWGKVIQYGGLTEADCYHPPANLLESWKDAAGGKVATDPAEAKDDKPAAGAKPAPAGEKPGQGGGGAPAKLAGGSTASAGKPAAPKPPAGGDTLPAPVMIDNHTLRVHVGKHAGRICFSVKQPGDPMPTTPDAGEAPAAKAPGKRDEFILACMNFLGAPYKAGSKKPAEGLDGANLIGLAMRRVGLFKTDEETPTDHEHLSALWHIVGAHVKDVPKEILPGDLVWFGTGDHDNDPLQHPMVYLGGGRALGPVPDGGPQNGAVQVIAIDKVPDKFAGWMHVDDFGSETTHTEHPGEPAKPGEKLTGALLPATPAGQYEALKALVARTGGKWEDGKGKVNLVGVKSMQDRCFVSPKPDDWNDTLFAAFLDEEGHKCCLDLRASLNPGTDSSKSETWQLWEGSWKFKLGAGDSVEGKALQPDGKIKGWLDKTGMGSPRPNDPDANHDPKDVKPGQPAPTDPKPPEKKPAGKQDHKVADTAAPFVFDAAGKKLSIKFGMRMMRRMIEWELKQAGDDVQGTVYSTNGAVNPYEQKVAGVAGQEWPEIAGMQIEPAKKVTVGGVEYGVWHAFGMSWGGTGSTNCCNSQAAAIFAALPDGKMRIKRADGVLELDLVQNTPKAPDVKNHAPDSKKAIGYGEAFAWIWIQGGNCALQSLEGKKYFGDFGQSAPSWAMKYLQVGEPIGSWGSDDALMKIRLGDSGQWYAHNWMVGDVRYQVTLKGRKTPVFFDQSDFVRGDSPLLQPINASGGYKLTQEDCLWAEAHEEEFEARLQAALTAKTMIFEGEKEVTKIVALETRVFSANCVYWGDSATASGKVYKKNGAGKWEFDPAHTKSAQMVLGISRPWSAFSAQIRKDAGKCWGFARWYDNAGGVTDFKPTGGSDATLSAPPPVDAGPQKAADDDAIPPPIEYKGGHDITTKPGTTFKDHPGTIVFVKEQFPAAPDTWEEVECAPHSHFAAEFCADLNGTAKGYEHVSPVQVFGPGKPFRVVDKFEWGQTGGAVFASLADGTTFGFGHMGEISARVVKAAKSGEELPAGTWLGSCKIAIGVTTGPHCHMQAWNRPENVLKSVHGLKRDVWFPRLRRKG